MKFRYALGMMAAALVPATLLAQVPSSPAERIVMESVEEQTEKTPLPVTLDDSVPEAPWATKVNADVVSNTAPTGSSAAEAMNLKVRTGTEGIGGVGQAPNAGYMTYDSYSQTTRGSIRDLIRSVRCWLRNFEPTVFHKGVMSFEYGTQLWRSPIYVASANTTRMIPQIIRVGYMFTEPDPNRRLKGVFEILAEADILPITSGNGNIIVGGSGLLRYHRVRNHRIVPYLQVGFGGTWTDANQFANAPTDVPFNFITQVGMGSHLFLNKKWAIMSESSYVFINSWGVNGGTGNGYHVLGGLIGITRYFGGSDCN